VICRDRFSFVSHACAPLGGSAIRFSLGSVANGSRCLAILLAPVFGNRTLCRYDPNLDGPCLFPFSPPQWAGHWFGKRTRLARDRFQAGWFVATRNRPHGRNMRRGACRSLLGMLIGASERVTTEDRSISGVSRATDMVSGLSAFLCSPMGARCCAWNRYAVISFLATGDRKTLPFLRSA